MVQADLYLQLHYSVLFVSKDFPDILKHVASYSKELKIHNHTHPSFNMFQLTIKKYMSVFLNPC